MIFGIGTDVVQLARVEQVYARHGEHFVRRLLLPEEEQGFRSYKRPVRFLAMRFAAKEAFAKAAGTGLRAPVTLHNIAVGHDAAGKPELHFSPALAQWLAERGVTRQHLSISDEKELAAAFVVLEG